MSLCLPLVDWVTETLKNVDKSTKVCDIFIVVCRFYKSIQAFPAHYLFQKSSCHIYMCAIKWKLLKHDKVITEMFMSST
jgi:hypothetical protein